MSRDASNRAQQASARDVALSKQYGANSDALHSQLSGIYSQNATNPRGMSPQELADARTGAMESAGGGVAAAVGEGKLAAARTGNAGGYQAALADAARKGIAQNASSDLKISNMNTLLKEKQREAGMEGLQHLQSQDQASTLGAMGINNGAINAETEAGKSGWFQNMIGLMNALKPAGGGGGE